MKCLCQMEDFKDGAKAAQSKKNDKHSIPNIPSFIASHKTKQETRCFAHLHLCILGELNAQKNKKIDSKFDGQTSPKKTNKVSKY